MSGRIACSLCRDNEGSIHVEHPVCGCLLHVCDACGDRISDLSKLLADATVLVKAKEASDDLRNQLPKYNRPEEKLSEYEI